MKEAINQKLDTTYTYVTLHITAGVIIAASLYTMYLSSLANIAFNAMLLPLFMGLSTYAAVTYYYQIYRRSGIIQFLKGLTVVMASGVFIVIASRVLSIYML